MSKQFKVVSGYNEAHGFEVGTVVTQASRDCGQYQFMLSMFGEEAMANTEPYVDEKGRLQLLDNHEIVEISNVH